MFEESETPINEKLILLVKYLKGYTEENPVIKLSEKNWIVVMPECWCTEGTVMITYNRFNARPFRVVWKIKGLFSDQVMYDTMLMSVSQAVNSVLLLKYSSLGIPENVIKHLAKISMKMTWEDSLKTVPDEEGLVLTLEQMKMLGLEKYKGKITGKKFGL